MYIGSSILSEAYMNTVTRCCSPNRCVGDIALEVELNTGTRLKTKARENKAERRTLVKMTAARRFHAPHPLTDEGLGSSVFTVSK